MQTWWLIGEDKDYRLRRISVGKEAKPASQSPGPLPHSTVLPLPAADSSGPLPLPSLEPSAPPFVPSAALTDTAAQEGKKMLCLAKQYSTLTMGSSGNVSDASGDPDVDVDAKSLLLNGSLPALIHNGGSGGGGGKIPDPVYV